MNARQTLLKGLLWAPARLYELAVRLRIAAYETGYLKSTRLDSVVISIGNITAGGTGKTPLVEYVARYLKDEGASVAILSRGYRRKSKGQLVLNAPPLPETSQRGEGAGSGLRAPSSYLESGDEPWMLAAALPDIPLIINKDRIAGGKLARETLGADVLILDDGYQHLALDRTLNILVLDATDPFGGFEMLPGGRLREPLYAIKRADAVIVTRAHLAFDQAQVTSIVRYFCGEKTPLLYVYSLIPDLKHLPDGQRYDAAEFTGWNAMVMCGIGNPRAFSEDLLRVGLGIVGERFFRDHHEYTQADFDDVMREAKEVGADMIVTTEKDAVRLDGLIRGDVPVYSAQLQLETEDEVRLKSLLLRAMIKR